MSKGNFIFECTNKKCKKHLVYWAETKHGGILKEGESCHCASRTGNIMLCPECNKRLTRYYLTCECGVETCGGMSSCANCYSK